MITRTSGFVTRRGIHFEVAGRRFHFAGCNCYHLLYSESAVIRQLLDEIRDIGATVVRIWVFGHEASCPVERPKGEYGEAYFQRLDEILQEAAARDLRLILVLENYWPDYGGIRARLEWEGLSGNEPRELAAFFRHPGCREGYRNYVRHVVTRTNGRTGLPYREDPTILAWELMNEPRCQGVSEQEDRESRILRGWVDDMGAWVKALDPRHLLGAGLEGHGSRYRFGGDEGNDYLAIHQSPFVDFCTSHPYPDAEWCGLTPGEAHDLVVRQVREAHGILGKPYIMEEFNSARFEDYEGYWRAMYRAVEEQDAAGDLFWCYHQAGGGGFNMNRESPVVRTVFRDHAAVMQAKRR